MIGPMSSMSGSGSGGGGGAGDGGGGGGGGASGHRDPAAAATSDAPYAFLLVSLPKFVINCLFMD